MKYHFDTREITMDKWTIKNEETLCIHSHCIVCYSLSGASTTLMVRNDVSIAPSESVTSYCNV